MEAQYVVEVSMSPDEKRFFVLGVFNKAAAIAVGKAFYGALYAEMPEIENGKGGIKINHKHGLGSQSVCVYIYQLQYGGFSAHYDEIMRMAYRKGRR